MHKDYKDLDVWNIGMELAESVYRVTEDFPRSERFGLSSQMRRAAVSIVSNIAEGRGRRSTGDFKRFVDIAYASLFELETQLSLSKRLEFMKADTSAELLALTSRVGRLLNGLRRSIGRNHRT